MKRILAILLTLVIILAALSGCKASDKEEAQTKDSKSMTLLIAETAPSCVAFEYREAGKPYCFYAYDLDGTLYRVLWTDFEGLSQRDRVIVEYKKPVKDLPDQEPADGGWSPKYELIATGVKVEELAPCLAYVDEDCVLTLPKSKQEITLCGEANMCAKNIVYELVEAAENKILEKIAPYEDAPLLYVQYSESYLWLCAEVIETIDPPAVQEQEDGTVITNGCNVDHKHLFFKEKIIPRAVHIMSIA